MNKVILTGRLAKDPEMRYTTSGKAVASFNLAVNRRRSANDQQTADFIPVVAWEKLGEICGNNLIKGSQVLVEGRMQIRSYEAQDGSKRYVTEVVANEIDFMGPKPSSKEEGGFGGTTVNNDDIPFKMREKYGYSKFFCRLSDGRNRRGNTTHHRNQSPCR